MGKVLMSGIVPKMVAPSLGIPIGDLAVGNSVFLNVNGVKTEFLIVNQGIPSGSSRYDASCDGTWLLMKDIYLSREWHRTTNHNYGASTINSYLNNTFFDLLDADVKDTIKTVKIPYGDGSEEGRYVGYGSNGLSTKIFLLSGYEVGWSQSTNSCLPIDGACLSYFQGASNSKRIAYLNGTSEDWWLRSLYSTPANAAGTNLSGNTNAFYVKNTGSWSHTYVSEPSHGIRPALIMPKNALFDEETMEFVGVA